jgi:hypothetical protein
VRSLRQNQKQQTPTPRRLREAMAAKRKSPSKQKKTFQYFGGIRASQEKAEYIVRKNTARDEWKTQQKYRKHDKNN